MVIVDTPVWSIALRKDGHASEKMRHVLQELIVNKRVVMLGPIRQEILSGIKHETQYEKFKNSLSNFSDENILTSDYENAAQYYNICRSKGIQGSNTDFLISAIAKRNNFYILTPDKDFQSYAKFLKFNLLVI